jgi:hypothetical protein
VDGRERHAEHGAGVAGVDDAVVVEPGGDEEGVGLGLDLRLDRRGPPPVGVLVERRAPGTPFDEARPTIDITPASCAAPITASFAPGQAKISRGSNARPDIP